MMDATLAGSNQSHKCILHIYDDRNDSSFDVNYIGFFFKNECNPRGVFARIKLMLNLSLNVDYNISENYKSLRYGKIIIHSEHSEGLMRCFQNYPGMMKYVFLSYDVA